MEQSPLISQTSLGPQVQPQQQTQALSPKKKKGVLKKKKDKDVLIERSRLDLFLEEYAKCNFNGTEAAMRVFNCSSRNSAAVLANKYLKRAEQLGRFVLEKKGYAYGDLIDMAIKRMQNPNAQDFVPLFDRMMKIGGYEDFLTKQGVTKATVSVLEVQKGLIDEFVDGEFVEE